jgi:hypothetical protein
VSTCISSVSPVYLLRFKYNILRNLEPGQRLLWLGPLKKTKNQDLSWRFERTPKVCVISDTRQGVCAVHVYLGTPSASPSFPPNFPPESCRILISCPYPRLSSNPSFPHRIYVHRLRLVRIKDYHPIQRLSSSHRMSIQNRFPEQRAAVSPPDDEAD